MKLKCSLLFLWAGFIFFNREHLKQAVLTVFAVVKESLCTHSGTIKNKWHFSHHLSDINTGNRQKNSWSRRIQHFKHLPRAHGL